MKKLFILAFLSLLAVSLSAQTVVFQETFEIVPLSVTPTGNPIWSRSNKLADNGTYSDSCQIATGDTAFLKTNTFSTMNSSYVVLEFSQICKIEFFDAAIIEVSIDNGISWTKLLASQYLGSGQFGTQGSKFTSASYPIWDPSNAATIPQNTWWQVETFDISSIASNQNDVIVRFTLYDGNNTGHAGNYGWLLDDIKVTVAASELIPPVVTLQAPIFQDTVFTTNPYEIKALITDGSGVDTAYVVYSINQGTNDTIGMDIIGTNLFSAFIPSQSYNTHIDYQVVAIDSSPAANQGQSAAKWFYVKKGPDIVTFGTGTLQNTDMTYPAPYGNYWYGARHQMMIRASELTAAGVNAGAISSLAFDVATINGIPLTGFAVKIGQTTQTDLSTWVTSPLATVFSSTTYTEVAGWNTHTFSQPFMWDGTSNLVIETCFNNTSYTNNAIVNQTATPFVSTIEYHNDASGICSSTSVSANHSQRPNIQLGVAPNNLDYDAGIFQIIEPIGTVISGIPQNVNIRLKNFGVQNLTTAQIGWSVNGVTQTPVPWTGNLSQDQVSNPVNLGQFTFVTGPYVVKAWAYNPNSQTDMNALNDTLSNNVFSCSSILSGSYSVGGTGADYPNIAAALTSLELCGIMGPVTFNINPGTYNERIKIPQLISGISSTNTVTFKGQGASTIIQHAPSLNNERYVVLLDNVKHIRFDSLTINIPDTALYGWGFFITNMCENIEIKNCSIKIPAAPTSTNFAGIVASGSYTSPSTTGSTIKKLLIDNNKIDGGYYGISIYGTSLDKTRDVIITRNDIKNVYYYGTYIYYSVAPIFTGNKIETRTTGTFTTSSYGMYFSSVDSAMVVTKNRIKNIGNYGMYFTSCISTPIPINISNNFIGGGFTSTGTPSGIYISSSSNLAITYNSINVDKGTGRGINTLSTAAQLSVLNNSFAYTGTGNGYAAYFASSASLSLIDHNNYFKKNSTYFVYYSVDMADLATLQAVNVPANNDANSKVGNPNYSTPTLLYPTGTQLWNAGTPIPTITEDIDGNLRSGTTPCIGAVEYTPPANDAALYGIVAPLHSACSLTNNEDVKLLVKNFGTATMTSVNASYKIGNATPVTETFTVNIPMDSIREITFTTPANLSALGTYTLNFWVNQTGDINQLNDSITNYMLYHSHDFYAGPYTQGFEPASYFADWSVQSAGTNAYKWEIPYLGSSYANSGDNSARFYNGSTNSGQDWLFSRCFDFVAGATYEISFYYRNGSTTTGNNLELKMGTAADSAQMNTSLVNLPGILNTTYLQSTYTFTVPSTDVYYFGWKAYSAPSSTSMYIDDINVKIIPPIEASIIDVPTPVSGCGLGLDTVRIVIKNSGSDTIDTDLTAYYETYNSGIVNETVTLTNLLPGQSFTYAFNTLVDLHTVNVNYTYNIVTWIDLTGDPLQFNDTLAVDVLSSYVPADPTIANIDIMYGQTASLNPVSMDSLYWYSTLVGGAPIFAGHPFVTPILFDTTTYYVEAMNGRADLKFTEITQYRDGTGATSPYPTWAVGADFAEITNLGTAQANLQNYTFEVFGVGARTYTFPNIQLGAGEVLLLHIGSGTDDPAHNYYNAGGSNDIISSTSISGYVLKDNANMIVDVVSCNSYTFLPASGVTSTDWSGTLSTSGAGVSRTVSDNNTASDWTPSTTTVQTIGSINPQLAGSIGQGGQGCVSNRVPVTVNVIMPAYEPELVAITAPVNESCTFGTEYITIQITNNGTQTITSGLNASYTLNGGSPVTEAVSDPIASGATIDFTFAGPLSVVLTSGDTTIDIVAYINHAGDPYMLNDTLSTAVTLLYTPDPPVATSPVTIPYGTTATITATSPQILTWYDMPIGGMQLDTGNSYITPVLYDTTTYYVEANNTILGVQTTVGTGTLTSYQIPTNTFYNYSWSASIYKANELNFSGLIDTIMYNVSGTFTPPYPQLDQRIYMMLSPDSTFTNPNNLDPATMTTVFIGNINWTMGVVKIPMQNAFDYDGSSNLIIYWENWDGGYVSPYPYFAYTTAHAGASKYAYSDVSFPAGSGTISTTRPNVNFSHSVLGCPSLRTPVQVNISNFPNNDAGIVSIDAPTSPTGFGLQNTEVTLHNYGATDLTNVTINWEVNGLPQTPFNWVGTLTSGQSISNVNIGQYNFTLGFHNFKVWTSNPNGSADIYNLNDTAHTIIHSYEPLNGIYTIGGTAPDYVDFTSARNDLATYGVSGPVTFKVRTGVYNEKLSLPAFIGASATNTVTFMPDINATVTLTAADTFVVRIKNAAYYIFDGSNNGTDSKDFSIINTSTGSNTAAIWISSVSSNVTIKNCIITGSGNTNTTIFGIQASGTTIGTTSSGNNNNLTIQNNTVTKAYYGIYVKASSTAKNNNLIIVDNFIGSNILADYVLYRGIDIQGAISPLISGNEIINMVVATSVNVSGIEIGSDVSDAKISSNIIHGLRSTSTGGYGAYGINIGSSTNVTNIEISNNFIYDIVTANYSITSTLWNPFGIRITGGTGHKIWNNSIHLYGAPTTGSNPSMSACLIVTTTAATGLDVRNNVFANRMTGLTGSKAYTMYIPSSSIFSKSDYNDYYYDTPFGFIGYSGSSDIVNIAGWRLLTLKDTNSVSVNPNFLTNSNLHTFTTTINGKATPIPSILTDIDGDTRDLLTPDMGADEYEPLDYDLGVVAVVSPSNNCGLSTTSVIEVTVKNNGQNTINTFDISYAINGATPVSQTFNGALATDSLHTFTFLTTADLSAISDYSIYIESVFVGDQYALNDTLTHVIPAIHDFANEFTMGFETNENSNVWSSLNILNDASKWVFPYNSTTYAHSGTYSAQFYNSTANPADDWLFSPCFTLEGGKSYKVEFYYRAASVTYPHNIKVMLGTDQTPLAMTDTIIVLNNFNNTAHVKASGIINVSTDGTYYFGWHAYSNASSYYAYIDDINIRLLAPRDAGITSIENLDPIANGGEVLNLEVAIRNFGADTLYSIPVKYSLNGGTPITETWMGTLLPDSSSIHTFATSFVIPDNDFALCTWTQLSNDGNTGNDTLCTTAFGIPLVTIPFTDDLEGAMNFYVTGLNNQWQHGVPSASVINTAHSPANVWATNLTGNYSNSSNYNLYSPRVSFTNMVNAEIGFWHWYDIEAAYDGGRIQYTIDNGNTWTTLGTVADPLATNWYTHAGINGAPAFSGTSSGWVYSTYNLSQFNNYPVPVQFRFNFFANSSNNANGWAIDDIVFFQNQIASDAGVIEITSPANQVVTGSQQTVVVKIKNYGTDPLTTIPVRYRVDNGVPVSEQWTGTLAPGDTTTFSFTTPLVQTTAFSLCAYTKVINDTYSQNDTTCMGVQIIPAQFDAGITEITTPGTQTTIGTQVNVTVKIKNFGSEILTSVPLQFDINSGTPVSGTYTGTLNPGDEVSHTFSQAYTSPSGNYIICAKTTLTTDQNITNDKLCKTVSGTTGINDHENNGLMLGQNIPNPAFGNTVIPFFLPTKGTYKFEIVNVIGQVVYISEKDAPRGTHNIEIDAEKLTDGVYYYTITFNEQRITKKLVVSK